MILLLGGTGETAALAITLADAGFHVLVSTVTNIPMELGDHANVSRRNGALDERSMEMLVRDLGIRAIVDATHPYSQSAHSNAKKAAAALNLPYLRWRRPEAIGPGEKVHFVRDHEEAALVASSFRVPILLTTGSTNLRPYVRECAKAGSALFARVLDHPQSVDAALKAGVPEENIVRGRGPFSVDDNLASIRHFKIEVLVTKDSGKIGGVPAKLEAARVAGCRVVVIRRPEEPCEQCYEDLSRLVSAVQLAVSTETRANSDSGRV